MIVKYLYSMKDNSLDSIESSLPNIVSRFVQGNMTKKDSQLAVEQVTQLLLNHFFSQVNLNDILLLPVLRAALPMWLQANPFFQYPESLFLQTRKRKGTSEVEISPPIVKSLANKNIILLDTVAASGDTLCRLAQYLTDNTFGKPSSMQIITCFSSPEAIEQIQQLTQITCFMTAVLMEGVDREGYLIPKLGGDLGDILFGSTYHVLHV